MSTTTEVIAHHWAFAVFLVVAIGLCGLMLLGAFFLGGRARARAKHTPFESGIDSVGTARMRLSAKFYLVAMFFVIFDVEALYLYAWSVSVRESGWVALSKPPFSFWCYWPAWFIWCASARWIGLRRVPDARANPAPSLTPTVIRSNSEALRWTIRSPA